MHGFDKHGDHTIAVDMNYFCEHIQWHGIKQTWCCCRYHLIAILTRQRDPRRANAVIVVAIIGCHTSAAIPTGIG